MSAQQIGPTFGRWSKIKNGKRWQASYRIDWWRSLEEYGTPFVPVIHWRSEQSAEQQTMLSPWPTRDSAAWAAERILKQLGYSREDAK